MSKLKYYFKKPKSEIAKNILGVLVIGGMVTVAATSPYFIFNIMRAFKQLRKYPNKRVYNTFYKLKKRGMINFYKKGNQIYISLTEKGKRNAGWMQVDDLKIKKPKKWDGCWRIVIFDIINLKRIYREALRGKLKDLGFHLLQKSVWIIPYDCKDEIYLLKDFFGLEDSELRLIVAKEIGNDSAFVKLFKLK